MRSFAQILCAQLWRALAVALIGILAAPAFGATDPSTFSYWISMRDIAKDAQPSYVIAAYNSGGLFTNAFSGCADHIYYLMDADAAKVQAARTAGDTVQVHRGPVGSTSPMDASIICLVQADQ